LLASSAHADNQWFLNNKIIPGATGQFLKTTEKGTYTVQVIKNQGCPSRMSEPILIN
jgi:membrane carboxypeptidase/penicillin-binding protein PbpC